MGQDTTILWNVESAAHLLRRACFGGTPEEAEELADLGLYAAVDKLLSNEAEAAAPPPKTDPEDIARLRQLRRAQRSGDEESRRALRALQNRQRKELQDLRYWWLGLMRGDHSAALEKLTLFWHGHFATSQTKVRSSHLMLVQNRTLRSLATGPFRDLCTAMVKDPAMLVWLDGARNNARSPNENFAREIMELFVLGEGHYTEEDIREAARCFTGWRVRPDNGEAVFTEKRHDDGRKTLFGKSGNFGTQEAVDLICSQPRCAEFLVDQIWRFYVYDGPDPKLVNLLAARYREKNLHTGDLLRMVFTHPEFYSARARAKQVKSPVQWIVQAARETGRQLLPPRVALPLAAELGQNLFMPPSVKGWDGGTAWANSATLIRRSNTARLFVSAAAPLPVADAESMNELAWERVAPQSTRIQASKLSERLLKLLLAVPPSVATRERLESALAQISFPCTDDAVLEAATILLGCPEYNLC
jgi:uncharacterized protein (DUF1800 family)